MEIKGAYSEYDKKELGSDIVEDYAPNFIPYGKNLTAGMFFKKQSAEKCFAFRSLKTEEQVKEEFLNSIPKDSSDAFVKAAKETIKIYRTYLPVEYFTVTQYEKTSLESTKHYKTTGYTATGRVSGNSVNVDVSENKEYSHTTYDFVSQTQKAKDKIYYTDLDKDLKIFKSKFYSTSDSDASNLVSADEIMEDSLLPTLGANSYRHKMYGSVKNYELHQILLFPLWRVEVTLNNNIYVNYVSDIEKSKIAYYNRSTKAKEKELADLEKEKKTYKKLKKLAEVILTVVGILMVISVLIHFFCSTTAADSDNYGGLLCRAFGGFGVFLTLIGGFSFIGYMLFIAGLVNYINMENLGNMDKIKNSELIKLRETLQKAPSEIKLIIGLSIAGLLVFGVETVFFIMFL